MKVIGQAQRESFLVEATGDELARLTGHHSQWHRTYDGRTEVKIGDEIDVNKLYTHFSHMQSAAQEIAKAKGILDAVSGGLTLGQTLIAKVMEPQKAAEKAE